jgi:hypothetical protein
MACVSPVHTHAHTRNYRSCSSQVERAPPLFSLSIDRPGADYETMDGGETTPNVPKVRTNHHLALLGTRMGGCSMPRVPQPSLRITNGHRPIYRSVLAVGPHSEHALSQATFWASQALALLQTGRNAHSSLEPKLPLPTPSCPPGLCLSASLLTCLLALPCCPAACLREMGVGL